MNLTGQTSMIQETSDPLLFAARKYIIPIQFDISDSIDQDLITLELPFLSHTLD